ncbi:MAG: glycoside hydrolase family 9 protein [Planctomycetes bacterium]|nr:glycoside hydrolase family 9 protein [Planctomycetota bacterium]
MTIARSSSAVAMAMAMAVTLILACQALAAAGEASSAPRVTGTCLVAPDIIALTIEAGSVIPGSVTDYQKRAGDTIDRKTDGGTETLTLMRNGVACGEIVGVGDRRQLITPASQSGKELDTVVADRAGTYTVSSADDPAFTNGIHPRAVSRKSKPIDYAWRKPPARHVLFLRMPIPLTEGRTYRIGCAGLGAQPSEVVFRNETRSIRSLAVHTTQIGYRADDPFKRGYLSIWLGWEAGAASDNQGAYSYPAGLRFQLLDDATGAEAFSGAVEMARRAGEAEAMFKPANYNGTDVLRMDFSQFTKPGRYRLHVDGIGCGHPFVIDDGAATWEHAFVVQMRGFLHQRSGIALGPPFTTFIKPRDHHPDDGVEILRSTWAAGIWSDDAGDEHHLQQGLKDHATNERVTNAWGGYHDAGDWNPRRVSHLRATMAQLEIADLFPDFAARVALNIPRDHRIPDLFNEVLFEIDCFRRTQTAEGGVGYGLETVGDPSGNTVSWHTTVLPVYLAAPDPGNSWYYTAVCARAARLLRRHDAKLAEVYAESAARAMAWAEAEFARQARERKRTAAELAWTARDSRNLAAVEMLRLTRDRRWHDLFLLDTVLTTDTPALFDYMKASQSDAAFAYAVADTALTDPVVRARAVTGLEMLADSAKAYADGNAFDIVCDNRYRPMFMGFYSTPHCGHVALRAYHLTGEVRHLETGVRACQFSSGANPDNLVFTTGLGSNPIRHPLHLDSRISGQQAPEGLTVYGIEDHVNRPCTWAYWILPAIDSVMSPGYLKWPLSESYTDTYLFIPVNEFTTDIWDESVWTWGYLAARPTRR